MKQMNSFFCILQGMFICFFVSFCIVSLSSCGGNANYSPLLVQADSALMRGFYDEADSLLSEYDRSQKPEEKSEIMYRELLRLTRAYIDNKLDVAEITAVDSLFYYYDDYDTPDKKVKTLLFLADLYKVSGDYPSALNNYLQARNLASENSNTVLQCWANQDIGDLYLDQKMFDECQEYYRQFYQIAENRRDTLRIAHASQRMGLVSTINNDIDSIAFYYKKAMSYGRYYPSALNTVEKSRHNLCDIYIQIEEYNKALALMTRDKADIPNWAYWHWGQNHVDSAAYYFKTLLELNPSKKLQTKAEYLRILVQIEKQRGNIKGTLAYYDDLVAIEDSIKILSQTEEMRKVNAQYNFNAIKQERDRMAEHQHSLHLILILTGLFLTLCIVFAWNLWKSYRHRKERQLMYERILRQRKEVQYRQSQEQLQENIHKLETLTQQLAIARQQNDSEQAKRLELETEMLVVQNKDIETIIRRKEYLTNEFEKTDLYKRLKITADTDNYHLSDTEWHLLGNYIDDIFDHFTSRLLNLTELSPNELHICYLVKLGLSPARIASLLCVTNSAVSKTRSRLFQKLTGQKGSSSQLDELIQKL